MENNPNKKPLIVFGARQVLIIVLIGLLTSILSSVLPISKISRKKPVELIRQP